MTYIDCVIKRIFDTVFSFFLLILFLPIILFAVILSAIDTRSSGIFVQKRVGKDGQLFSLYKIQTMIKISGIETTITTSLDARITHMGSMLRRTKIDELPQLINVFFGQMSFVGPRPDVIGFADSLEGKDMLILTIRPGITGPATLKYRNEEELLASVEDPESYNRKYIFPDKVRINREYIQNYTFLSDIKYMLSTILGRTS